MWLINYLRLWWFQVYDGKCGGSYTYEFGNGDDHPPWSSDLTILNHEACHVKVHAVDQSGNNLVFSNHPCTLFLATAPPDSSPSLCTNDVLYMCADIADGVKDLGRHRCRDYYSSIRSKSCIPGPQPCGIMNDRHDRCRSSTELTWTIIPPCCPIARSMSWTWWWWQKPVIRFTALLIISFDCQFK